MTSFPPDQVEELKRFFPGVSTAQEVGTTYFLLPDAALPPGCSPSRCDMLLCPTERDGYPSRLYFAQQLQTNANRNWNGSCRVLDRTWWTFSWKIETGLRLIQMIRAHLKACE